MRQLSRHSRRDRQVAQALIEFALILPLLILMLFGIMAFGQLWHDQVTLNSAAREAVRRGAVGRSDAELAVVIQQQTWTLDQSRLSWSFNPPDTSPNRAAGRDLTVRIEYDDRLRVPLAGIILGTKKLVAVSTARIEVFPSIDIAPVD